MKKDKILFTIISVFSWNIYSQKTKLKSVSNEQKMDSPAYINPMKTYEKVADKGYKSEIIFKKLGDVYYFDSKLEKAAKWYGELFDLGTELESEYYYRYAQSLKAIGNDDKAAQLMEKFNQLIEMTTENKN